MKNYLLISNIVLTIAVIVLLILMIFPKKSTKSALETTPTDTELEETLPIAYVNIDSLLLNYNLYKKLSEELLQQEEKSRGKVTQQAVSLQKEMAEFQKKVENQAFLNAERAQAEQSRLLKQQQELQDLDARLTKELMSKQQKMNEQLKASIDSIILEFNKDNKYHLILSNTGNDNILYGNKAYNITNEILKLMNVEKE
ncbi:MAG: OmpH family outer membrane protein [Paludibacteraceae bacterium]|jgi:outer membrane protein|nr:OmpH family outer membrane protein [Paludibacteraceae bacterium]MBP6436733.1 OmpH family outer membrane protein [Paludibacteraceae bacterium]MBP8628096.1 OmpH family outer membrane protein [Paludibacteraceae bacterium]MBP9648928.1 OmpH family outer membrane protein [Paludibacteraceae bacterium]MBP9970265.1 OmpH family outer membrane protein [Paludibacteraceae bacterium]